MRAVGAALFLWGLGGCTRSIPISPPRVPERAVTSNVLRSDHAGSQTCATCHAELFAAWDASPMRQMTRHASTAAIRAPVDGPRFHFKSDETSMESRDGQRLLRFTSPRFADKLFLVTKVIGGRYREDFVGAELLDGGSAKEDPRGPEVILPVSWIFSTQSWRYKGYSTMTRERPYLAAGPVWKETCIFCHNTPPLMTVLLDELRGPAAPLYQGTTGDALLPARLRFHYQVRDGEALVGALSDELKLLGEGHDLSGTKPAPALDQAIRATAKHFDQQHLLELGIGCEACHGGSREHVEDPSVIPSYLPVSPMFAVTNPEGQAPTRAEAMNRVCARCHSVLFSKYPFSWEGGDRADLEGGSHINSGEGRDFLLGHCSKQLTCTACHDPHREDERGKLKLLGTPGRDGVCLRCHPALGSAQARQAHTHHLPGSEGSGCLGCHMPMKNIGLGYAATRYHRIGSPTDSARVEKDRPLECALCHTDKSVLELTTLMEQWWGKQFSRAALQALYGNDLSANVLLTTLERGRPHEQLAAISALGLRPVPGTVEALVKQLAHPFPLVRFQAKRALEQSSGRAVDIDLNQTPAELEPQLEVWLHGAAQ